MHCQRGYTTNLQDCSRNQRPEILALILFQGIRGWAFHLAELWFPLCRSCALVPNSRDECAPGLSAALPTYPVTVASAGDDRASIPPSVTSTASADPSSCTRVAFASGCACMECTSTSLGGGGPLLYVLSSRRTVPLQILARA